MASNFQIGDIVETKKPHPCGVNRWRIIRTGADIKLRCEHCQRIVMMTYEDFVKRYKRTVSKFDGN